MVIKIVNRKDNKNEMLGRIKNFPAVGNAIELYSHTHPDTILLKTSEIQRITACSRSNKMEIRTLNSTYFISLPE